MKAIKTKFRFNIKDKKTLGIGIVLGVALLGGVEFSVCKILSMYRLRTEDGKALHALGRFYANRIDSMHFSKSEADTVMMGFREGLKQGGNSDLSVVQQEQLQRFMDAHLEKQIAGTKKAGSEYISQYIKSGAMHTLTGLAFRVISPGSVAKPTLKDWVEVRYQGRLIDGKVIDGTDATGKTAKFPMNGVIPGWTEGLQQIGEGGEIELVVPPELAYGDSNTSSGIPAGSTLVFRIQLVHVIKDGRKDLQK